MLLNPPKMSGLHARQRQHRRQNSTPSAFDTVKIAPLPNIQQRRPISHRRGLSLDTRGQRLAPAPPPDTSVPQEYNPISMPATDPEPARTPQRTPRSSIDRSPFIEQDAGDNFLISPQVTPQGRRFTDAVSDSPQFADFSGLPFDPYSTSAGFFDRSVSRLSSNGIEPAPDFDFFNSDTALSTPSFITFPESSPRGPDQGWGSESETTSTHSRRSSRRISNGVMDKIANLEAMGGEFGAAERPCTPGSQLTNNCFPQTPTEGSLKQEPAPLQPPNRFTEGYDESMEETLKPIRATKNNRNSGIFQDLRQQAEAMAQTPPRTNSIPMALTAQGLRTPDFMNMRNISAEFKKIEREFAGMPASPTNAPSMFPFPKADNNSGGRPDFPSLDTDAQNPIPRLGPPAPVSKSTSRRGSPHRRTESIASITSAASIADINIEETRTETGVTLEDIAAYIQGPDPSDGKWRCLYEGCNKIFGRKENIKSHVQTHLNDRQYQCPTCKKCFVRQHDLKRHAKIHTGIKPYPCECGNSFARHDALTRHRQRGMCIGAFDGVVRKVVKRGRPKKIRPDMDERRDKAERTRRKNKLTSANSASSQSGYSDISGANSPNNEFDGLLDDDKFQDILSSSIASLSNPMATATMNPSTLAVSTAPMPASSGSASTTTTTTTMAEVFQRALSPSAMSSYSHASHASSYRHHAYIPVTSERSRAGADGDIQNPPSPAKSVSSHYSHATTTPPDLSSPRSPPPLLASCSTPFFDELNDDVTHNSSSSNNSNSTAATTTSANRDNAADADLSDVSIGGLGGGYHHGLAALEAQHDMLLGFHPHHPHNHAADGLVPLDGPGGGAGGVAGLKFEKLGFEGLKFEDEGFDPVSMFTSGEDVFFGTG
ncbi:hypothetical protein VTG60DRAFT_513 [Thermothelomyces hinnuleus]